MPTLTPTPKLVFDASATGSTAAINASSLTVSHVAVNSINGILVVNVAWLTAGITVSSVTYNGRTMTSVPSVANGNLTVQQFFIRDLVGTANVVITMSASSDINCVTIGMRQSFAGAYEVAATATGSATGSSTIAATPLTYDTWMIDAIALNILGVPTATGTNHTLRNSASCSSVGSGLGAGTTGVINLPASTSVGYTFTAGSNYAASAIIIKPAVQKALPSINQGLRPHSFSPGQAR